MAKQRTVDFWMGLAQVFLDALVLYLTFCLAFWVRFYSGFFEVPKGIPPLHQYLEIFPVATLVMLLVFKSMGLYVKKGIGTGIGPLEVFKAITLGTFVLMSITFIYREVTYSRLVVIIDWLFCILLVPTERFFWETFGRRLYQKLGLRRKVLVIGTSESSERIIENLQRSSGKLYQLVGILAENGPGSGRLFHGNPAPVLGSVDAISEVLTQEKVDEVILALPDLEQRKIVEIILACEREMVRFRMVPDIFEILTSQVEVENFYGVTLLGLKPFPLEKAINRFWKRFMDITGAGLGILVSVPLWVVLAIWIKRDSPGPVFYRQERVGEDGRHFRMVKFRTMREDAEEETGPVWASQDDPRRTKAGRVLRRYNLDELPQLWNVFKGDMSLVGPRPERPHFVNDFKDRVPRYMSRHKIKSGMTGWAQINGLRGNTSVLERIKYDLYYLENWSILFDMKIILKTFLARQNAY